MPVQAGSILSAAGINFVCVSSVQLVPTCFSLICWQNQIGLELSRCMCVCKWVGGCLEVYCLCIHLWVQENSSHTGPK